MDGVFSDLGENIVRTAKLAVAIHLRERFLREAARQRIEENASQDVQPQRDPRNPCDPRTSTQGGK